MFSFLVPKPKAPTKVLGLVVVVSVPDTRPASLSRPPPWREDRLAWAPPRNCLALWQGPGDGGLDSTRQAHC